MHSSRHNHADMYYKMRSLFSHQFLFYKAPSTLLRRLFASSARSAMIKLYILGPKCHLNCRRGTGLPLTKGGWLCFNILRRVQGCAKKVPGSVNSLCSVSKCAQWGSLSRNLPGTFAQPSTWEILVRQISRDRLGIQCAVADADDQTGFPWVQYVGWCCYAYYLATVILWMSS